MRRQTRALQCAARNITAVVTTHAPRRNSSAATEFAEERYRADDDYRRPVRNQKPAVLVGGCYCGAGLRGGNIRGIWLCVEGVARTPRKNAPSVCTHRMAAVHRAEFRRTRQRNHTRNRRKHVPAAPAPSPPLSRVIFEVPWCVRVTADAFFLESTGHDKSARRNQHLAFPCHVAQMQMQDCMSFFTYYLSLHFGNIYIPQACKVAL